MAKLCLPQKIGTQQGECDQPCAKKAKVACSNGPAESTISEKDLTLLRDLASEKYGSSVLFATDEWFAVGKNLLKSAEPAFDPDAFCDQGKVMDGWESRRRRTPGHDWCIIKLGLAGRIQGLEIDTAWFTGNQAPKVSVYAAEIDGDDDAWIPQRSTLGVQGTCSTPEEIALAEDAVGKKTEWLEMLSMTPLRPGYKGQSVHRFIVPPALAKRRVTHLRLNQHPDGGIARLRAYGMVWSDFDRQLGNAGLIDLAAAEHGGRGLDCSNMHYGVPRNLCDPGRGRNMGDGWETARNPLRPAVIKTDPATGFVDMPVADWCIIRLGAVAERVEKLVIDTHFFKGNYPESVLCQACCEPSTPPSQISQLPESRWTTLLPRTRLGPDKEHTFELASSALREVEGVTHVKVSIFPDGGIMRLRVFGRAKSPMLDAN